MNDLLALGGRVLLSPLFIVAAYDKLTTPDITRQFFGSVGLPAPELIYWPVVLFELGAGLALLFGLQTRVAALLLAPFCVATAFLSANIFVDWSQWIGFFKNVAIAGGLLFVVAHGSGRYSLDAAMGRRPSGQSGGGTMFSTR